MVITLLLLSVLAFEPCEPLIKTEHSEYVFGDSIRIEISNACGAPISYGIFLQRWNTNNQKWHMVDVDVFMTYLYLGALKELNGQSSTTLYNLREDYGEQFSRDDYKNGGVFRYGIDYEYLNGKKMETVYSNEFKITPSR